MERNVAGCQSINDLTEFDRSAMKLKIIVCSHIPRKSEELLAFSPMRASCELQRIGITVMGIRLN
jgi:phosphate uptake regulator